MAIKNQVPNKQMEEIRKHHNAIKRHLIQNATRQGMKVLDVGCGCGGDLQKWKYSAPSILDMCDPSEESLEEARSRSNNLKINANFYLGTVFNCPNTQYDIICYNFSLHYIFESTKTFFDSIRAIRDRLKPGGRLIGIIPDSDSILFCTPFKDNLGNFLSRGSNTGQGNIGEKIFVFLSDTPYYKEGPKAEPLAYRDLLITHLEHIGIHLESWKPLNGTELSQMYSQFIFIRK